MPGTTFKEYFCLRDRENFNINVKASPRDAELYFGNSHLNDTIVKACEDAVLLAKPPKMYLWGPYGSGKTHTLFHLKHHIENKIILQSGNRYVVPVFEVELHAKTTYQYLHQKMLEALGMDRVREYANFFFQEHAGQDDAISAFFRHGNIVAAFRSLSLGGAQALIPWRWLCGIKLKQSDLDAVGLTASVDEVYDMVEILTVVGRLAARRSERIVFLIDEAEALNNVSDPDAQETFHDGLRKLADQENDAVGFVLSFFALGAGDMPGFMARDDIVGRLGRDNIIQLPYLDAVEDVRAFLADLRDHFFEASSVADRVAELGLPAGSDALFPFEPDALDQFAAYATQDPTRALPRNILNALSSAAVAAYKAQAPLVSLAIVDETAPLVFA